MSLSGWLIEGGGGGVSCFRHKIPKTFLNKKRCQPFLQNDLWEELIDRTREFTYRLNNSNNNLLAEVGFEPKTIHTVHHRLNPLWRAFAQLVQTQFINTSSLRNT